MTNPVARIKAKVDHRNLHNWGWWPARETVAHLKVTSTNAPNEGQMVSNRQRNGTNNFSWQRFNLRNSKGRCRYSGILGHCWRESKKRLRGKPPSWQQNASFGLVNQQTGQIAPFQLPTQPTG